MKTCPNCHKPLASNAPDGLCPECLVKAGLPTGVDITDPAGPHGTKVTKPPPTPDEICAFFPQFDIMECLGRGGMGVVYKARQPKLNRIVALKILAPEKVAEPKFAERFEREAQALARLNHPNIVTVYDFGETGGLYYLTMEFVDGASLRQLLQTRKIAPEEALAIVPKICEALQFAHDKGVVHRDIKPENVLVDRSGQVKIADFGIAKIVGTERGSPSRSMAESSGVSEQTDGATANVSAAAGTAALRSLTQDQILGTPNYMAPEQVEHPQTVDHRADIYSLGVVFYEMLTGELPLGKFQPPSKKVQIDVRLDEIVLRALEKEPELRYQQASVLRTDVETVAASPSSGSSGRQSAPSEDQSLLTSVPTTSRRFSRTAIVGAVLASFGLLALVLFLFVCTFHQAGGPFPLVSHQAGQQVVYARSFLLLLPLFLLGLVAVLGTTILGWIAVSQIRRSAGRLYGLGLAVFDGLLFPLLVVDALVIGLLKLACRVGYSQMQAPGHADGKSLLLLTIAFLIVAVVLLDVWIIRRVWRAVNQPLNGKPPPATGAAALQKTASRWDVGHVGWKIAALVCGLTLLWFAILKQKQREVDLLDRQIKVLQGTAARSQHPKAEHISTNHLSVLLHGDDVDLHYALFYAGNFGSSVADSKDIGGNSWLDNGGITLVNGRTFGYRRESSNPERLQLNGRVFDLRAGRVFVLEDDGTVEQQFLFPPLEVARDLEALSQLIRDQHRDTVTVISGGAMTFGPVIERVVNDEYAKEGNNCLDLDSGQVFTLPEPRKADFTWMLKNGIDAVCAMDGTASQGLAATGGTVTQQIPNERWETIPADEIISTALRQKPDFGGLIGLVDKGAAVGKPTLPVTFIFRTREGGMGVLQVLAHTDNPRGVKIRYKLVQDSGVKTGLPPKTAATVKQPEAVFRPVIQRVLASSGGRAGFHGLDLESGVSMDCDDCQSAAFGGRANPRASGDSWEIMFRNSCVDLLAVPKADATWELVGRHITLAPIPADCWNSASLGELRAALKDAKMENRKGWQIQTIRSDCVLPLTIAVLTDSEAVGVLQIIGFTNNPAGVKLRYKLAERTQPPPLEAAIKGIKLYGGFVKTNAAGRIFRVSMVYDEDENGKRVECPDVTDFFAEWLPAFTQLEELWLKDGQVTDRAMRHVGGLRDLKMLLMWDANRLTDDGAAQLANLQQLQVLHISKSRIGDDALAVLAGLPKLQSLSLQGNQVGDRGLENIKSMTQLTNLWIGDGIKITDRGLGPLKGLVNLQQLELQQCRITDKGLLQMRHLKNLRRLIINGTETTEDGRAQLKAAIPALEIQPSP